MFKIRSNVGGWRDLYISPDASETLREFALSHAAFEGETKEGFNVTRLAFKADQSRAAPRPSYVVLVCSKQVDISAAKQQILTRAGDDLEAIVAAEQMETVKSNWDSLVRTCEALDLPSSRVNQRGKQALDSQGVKIWGVPITFMLHPAMHAAELVICIVNLVVCCLLLFKGGAPGQNGVDGKNGTNGVAGAAGETGYLILRENTVQKKEAVVGDILLHPESEELPNNFLRCYGQTISKREYPAFFRAAKLEGPDCKLPKLSGAPEGYVYVIKVK